MTTQATDRQIEARLAARQVRYTAGRRTVVSALIAADGPRSASELFVELGMTVPLSSLYRSIAVLEEAGVVVPHHGARGLTRYEMAEWLAGHHHHLVCVDCGVVEDIRIPGEHESALGTIIGVVTGAASFVPTDHSLEIEGRCSRCA
jgi:Fur family transcriptional regulator, ferric uptake regulator